MEKGQFFQWSWNFKGNLFKNFKKNLINLIDINHQIKLTSDYSVSINDSFKSQEFKY